ncbi:hypothetical protein [Reyranella sp.]|uniref:hypothetical protein n=1 Tax=Reyranella sp. TaxID=1929291 RepID=UPI003D150531
MTLHLVAAALQRLGGTHYDDALGGVIGDALEKLAHPDVKRVFLPDSLVVQANAPLSTVAPSAVWVEWDGGTGGDMLATNLGSSAAAFIEPIAGGAFSGGCAVEFWAATPDGVLPMPGKIIVTDHRSGGLSPIDEIRAASRVQTAADASTRDLVRMDGAVCRYLDGSLYLRTLPSDLTNPVGDKSLGDGWRTWTGDGLRTALANTAVEHDHTAGLMSWRRPEPIRRAAQAFSALLIEYGPRAALRILSTLAIRRRLN